MTDIRQFFNNLWLTDFESKVYLFLLSQWESIASIIAKRLSIKRWSIYSIIEWLENKSMIITYEKNNINYYKAVSPADIIEVCKEKEIKSKTLTAQAKEVQSLFENIKNSQNIYKDYDSSMKYYQWSSDVSSLIDETLEESWKEILCFWITDFHLWNNEMWNDYTKKRINNWFKVKSIQPNNKKTIEYKKRDLQEFRKTCLVPEGDYPNNASEINIIGDTIAFFTSEWKTPIWFKLRNKSLASALSSVFNLAWKSAKDYDKKD